MKRKVVQHGTNTLTVSLPTEWTKRNKITVGDELEVVDKLTKLEILKEKEEEKKEITLEIKDVNTYIFKRYLGNVYRQGYDSILLKFPDEKIKDIALEHVNNFLDMCIGMEVISHEKNTILIKTVASVKPEEFMNALRRFFLLSLQVAETFSAALEKKENASLSKVLEIEKKQNTLYLYCIQVLNKTAMFSKRELLLYHILIERLEEVCDEFRDMALYMQENNCTAGNSIKEFAKKAEEYFRLIYDLYYSFDEKIIITITKQREEFKETERLFFKNKSKEEIILFHFMFNAIIKIYEASSPIVGLHVGKSYGTK